MKNYVTIERWTDSLRNGGFTQIKNALHDGEGYCCLGVLCEITGVQFTWNADQRPNQYAIVNFVTEAGYDNASPASLEGVARDSINRVGLLRDEPLSCSIGNIRLEKVDGGVAVIDGRPFKGDRLIGHIFPDGVFDDGTNFMSVLMNLNDMNFTFSEIADFIDNVAKPGAMIEIATAEYVH